MILEIAIDPSRKLAIKQGQKVDVHTPLYRFSQKQEQRIEVASKLSISPKLVISHMKKTIGDIVQSGETIAEIRSFFNSRKVISSFRGVIKEIDHIEGIVLVESESEESSDNCWFAGEIVAVSSKKVSVKIGKHQSYPAKRVDTDFGGQTWILPGNEHVPEYPVALAESLTEYDVAKLEALDGRGIVTTLQYSHETALPRAEFKLKDDCQSAITKYFSYCLVQKEHSTIIFYTV